MARIVIRCQYSGHYIVTPIDTARSPDVGKGRVFCPYCKADHVWTCERDPARGNNAGRSNASKANVRAAV